MVLLLRDLRQELWKRLQERDLFTTMEAKEINYCLTKFLQFLLIIITITLEIFKLTVLKAENTKLEKIYNRESDF